MSAQGHLAQEEVQERLKVRCEMQRRLAVEDLRAVASSPAGRRFLWRVIDSVAGVCNGSFTGEALTGAFAEGRRAVGRELQLELQREHPDFYVLMVEEAIAAAQEDAIHQRDVKSAGNSEENEDGG